jgi:hypothetical protein
MAVPCITMADIREARRIYGGYCIPGVKAMAAFHGIEYRRLVRGQVTVTEAEALGDALVAQLASVARRRAKNE